MDGEFVRLLCPRPDIVENLLRRHVSDEHGHCLACTRPGTGIAHVTWPCSLRYFAQLARAAQAGP
jgi:hypothetical protein